MDIAKKILRAKTDYDRIYNKFDLDSFWDKYQDYGNRTNYTRAFALFGWSPNIFQPKYPMYVTNSYAMFYFSGLNVDLRDYDITFKLNGNNSGVYTFYNTSLKGLPKIDCSELKNQAMTAFLSGDKFKEIDELILNDTLTYTGNWLTGSNITKIIFGGSIGNTMILKCPQLNKESLISLITTLSPLISGKTLTVSSLAVNNAFETSTGEADGILSDEWINLVDTRPNWTITCT